MKIPNPSKVSVYVDHLGLEDLQILHISDLHINKKTDLQSIKTLVKSLQNYKCDFVVITGDIIDCKAVFIKEQLSILNSLSKTQKVFYISGNHDLFYGLKDLKHFLKDFILLDNINTLIEYQNQRINLVGISDRFSKFFKIKRDEKKVLNLLDSSLPTIFIAHQPKDYRLALKSATELFLCGHTHGGQIYPFHYLVRLVQPFLSGLHYIKDTAIYVNKGLGNWGLDFRYKADSEITLLKLTAKRVK